jgi:hypothetical protein
MALLLILMILPPVCAAALLAYRIWPVTALYGVAAAVWLGLLVLAAAGLAFVIFLKVTVDPRGGWDAIGAGLLVIYSIPLLASGVLALFLRPPPPGGRECP